MGHDTEIHKSGVSQTTLLVEQSKKRGYMVMMKLSTMKKIVETVNSDWRSPIAEKIMEKWEFDEKEMYYYREVPTLCSYFARLENLISCDLMKSKRKHLVNNNQKLTYSYT
jgi:DNA-binding sugar fermentation-stimulating protein